MRRENDLPLWQAAAGFGLRMRRRLFQFCFLRGPCKKQWPVLRQAIERGEMKCARRRKPPCARAPQIRQSDRRCGLCLQSIWGLCRGRSRWRRWRGRGIWGRLWSRHCAKRHGGRRGKCLTRSSHKYLLNYSGFQKSGS